MSNRQGSKMDGNNIFIKEPCLGYDDAILYGRRREIAKYVESTIRNTASECVHHFIKCALPTEPWSVGQLTQRNPKLEKMVKEMDMRSLMPVQRYSWPLFEQSPFPVVYVSPAATGKTSAIVLYIVAKIIASTPISKTYELLHSANQASLNSFKISDLEVARKGNANGALDEDWLENIDHNNFDYNSLGKDPVDAEEKGEAWDVDLGDLDLEKLMIHPKYIVVSCSQQQVEANEQEFVQLKSKAYDNDKDQVSRRINFLNPVVKTVNFHQDDSKLAMKCTDTEVLLTTPLTLLRCIRSNFIDLNKCDKLFFDDIDVILQLHSSAMREIVKIYLSNFLDQQETLGKSESLSQPPTLHLFSRKWTELVNKFINTVSLQSAIVFGSSMEAALYANVRLELEFYNPLEESKHLQILMNILTYVNNQQTTAIMCCTDAEATHLRDKLTKEGYLVKYLNLDETTSMKQSKHKANNSRQKCIHILCDTDLEILLDSCPHLSFITCLIHYSTPDNMTVLDQRFRIMHHHLRELTKDLSSTILLKSSADLNLLRQLYDFVSRSSNTLNSAKLALKNLVDDRSIPVCWRWASTGVCRLEKYSRNDKFGSYCTGRHSLAIKKPAIESSNRWPTAGQCRITITNLVSPSEFYFWFEAQRGQDHSQENWVQLERSGSEYFRGIQEKLDSFRNTVSCSIPLNKFKLGKIYGVYFHEDTKVHRVKLLDLPFPINKPVMDKFTSISYYSKTCQILKIDYGILGNAYVRNIFELPPALANLEPLCHRGVHIGYRPTGNELDWWYKARKFFYEHVSAKNIVSVTAWVRLNSNKCFWFEDMLVSKRLESNQLGECKISTTSPHHELCVAGFAAKVTPDPVFLLPSQKLNILSKWHVDGLKEHINYAFLRKDRPVLEVFVLDVTQNLLLGVRACDYNKMLINLEDSIMDDYKNNRLQPLNYLAEGVHCLAKIRFAEECVKDNFSINRCVIESIKESPINPESTDESVNEYHVKCLDHHDTFIAAKSDLYLALPEHFSKLPFQAITCHISRLNPKLLEDESQRELIGKLLLDYSRTEDNQLKKFFCVLDKDGKLDLHVPIGKDYESLANLFKQDHGIDLLEPQPNETIETQ